jgi:hypothetical protein
VRAPCCLAVILFLAALTPPGRPGATPRNDVSSPVLPRETPELAESRGAPDPAAQVLGAKACTPCHQQHHGEGDGLSAVGIWQTEDLHARAFAVLTEPAAERMTNLLGLKPPAREPLCLACHVQPAARSWPLGDPRLAEGVNCEACHGPAEKWLSAHYRQEWKASDDAAKEKLGWRDTRGLFNRAQTCLPCHVGQGDMDVNHDLIAAGHPALFFELTSALRRMPRHWPRSEPSNGVDAGLQLWLIGQQTSAAAALDLLAARATGSLSATPGGARTEGPRRPWPELAEYDCFACHQDLVPRADTGSAAAGREAAGREAAGREAAGREAAGRVAAATWQPWYGFLDELGLQSSEPAALRRLVHGRMASLQATPQGVATLAEQAATALRSAARGQVNREAQRSADRPSGAPHASDLVRKLVMMPRQRLHPASALQRRQALQTLDATYLDPDWR